MFAALTVWCLAQAVAAPTGQIDIMIVGSVHLRQINPDSTPIAVSLLQRSFAKFQPDLVVVEWLHPSIDPATTFNYRPLENFETLARLWGMNHMAAATRDSLVAAVAQLKQASAPPAVIAMARILLGKAYYLTGDQINAAYQWWRAQKIGLDVTDLARLTSNNFAGHEANEFGFTAALAGSAEYLTAFDYQGPDARPEVWGDMLDSLRVTAIAKVHRATQGDPGWQVMADSFTAQRRRFEGKQDTSLLREYGAVPEVRQYVAVLQGFDWQAQQEPRSRDGLALMRYLQSPHYEAVERRVQTVLIPGIGFGGFGRQRLEGIMARNQRMFEFLDRDVKRLGARRVMVVVGAGHKFALEDLARQHGYRIIRSEDYLPN